MIKFKEIFKLSVPLLLSAAAVASCVNGPEYESGPLETENNYGVYFPEHTANSKLQLTPDDQKEVRYKVKRTNTADAISVPLEITESEKDIFYVSEVWFDEGEDEAELTIAFPKAKTDGTEYSIAVNIVDPKYISLYSKRSKGISFSVSIASWKNLETEGKGMGRWRDDILSSMYGGLPHPHAEAEVEIQEREDKEGLYRIKAYSREMMAAIFDVPYATDDKYIIVDATDPDKVWIPRQEIGVTLNSEDGAIRVASFVDKQFSIDESQNMYGKLDENGVITFPVGGIYCNLTKALGENDWIPVNSNGMLRIMLPGARLYDYSVALKNLGQVEDQMTFSVKIGSDATKFVYKIYEGDLDKGSASLFAQELAGENGGVRPEPDGESTGDDIIVKGLKTNRYTLVGYTCKADGKMKEWGYINFGFVGKGDDKSVRLTIGLEGTNEFAGQGIHKDNAVKFYAYGDEITEARYWLYRTDKVKDEDAKKMFDKRAKKFTEEELKLINEKRFSTMLKGLNGQCNYKLMVKAYNGYCEEVFVAEYSTEGIFNPALEDYTYSEFKKVHTYEYLLGKEWNFYATNQFDKKITTRQLMPTKVHFKKSGIGELKIFGLSGLVMDEGSEELGMTVRFDVNEGIFGLDFSQETQGICQGKPVVVGVMPDEDLGTAYSGQNMMFLGKVEEGYMYLVPNPKYASVEKLTFANIIVRRGSEVVYWLTEIMLVDSSVDIGI